MENICLAIMLVCVGCFGLAMVLVCNSDKEDTECHKVGVLQEPQGLGARAKLL